MRHFVYDADAIAKAMQEVYHANRTLPAPKLFEKLRDVVTAHVTVRYEASPELILEMHSFFKGTVEDAGISWPPSADWIIARVVHVMIAKMNADGGPRTATRTDPPAPPATTLAGKLRAAAKAWRDADYVSKFPAPPGTSQAFDALADYIDTVTPAAPQGEPLPETAVPPQISYLRRLLPAARIAARLAAIEAHKKVEELHKRLHFEVDIKQAMIDAALDAYEKTLLEGCASDGPPQNPTGIGLLRILDNEIALTRAANEAGYHSNVLVSVLVTLTRLRNRFVWELDQLQWGRNKC